MEPTAPIAPGPNAVAVLDSEFSRLFREARYERLAQALKFAIAYNVLALKRSTHKAQEWTVLQLNGLLCIYSGLALAQGNVVDVGSLEGLEVALDSP